MCTTRIDQQIVNQDQDPTQGDRHRHGYAHHYRNSVLQFRAKGVVGDRAESFDSLPARRPRIYPRNQIDSQD
jgi:hypothetical protein